MLNIIKDQYARRLALKLDHLRFDMGDLNNAI